MIPQKVFLTKGTGHGNTKILSFEKALREARISRYNLVKVSSILPPSCEKVSIEEGINELSPGQIVYVVLSRITVDNASSSTPDKIFASIGIAQPLNPTDYGYVAELNGIFTTLDDVIFSSRELATELLVSSGKPFRKDEISTSVISANTQTNKGKKYSTCIAAAVFIV